MDKKKKILAWCLQIMAAAILLPVGFWKFGDNPTDLYIFSTLEMEPSGRYIIGALEVLSGLLLMTEIFSATGAFLSIGVMCGAILAHATTLGIDIQGDNGKHIILLIIVLASCLPIVWIRRKQLPLIGDNL